MKKKLIPTIILAFAILTQVSLAQEATQTQSPTPKFLKVGKTYRTGIGSLVELTFKVLEIDGSWMKVEPIDSSSKKAMTGDAWLNINALQFLAEGERPKEDKKPSDKLKKDR